MNVGDEEEHAVLLTNFFLGIGKKAWLIIGKYLRYITYYRLSQVVMATMTL
jgi:hypothetical protein